MKARTEATLRTLNGRVEKARQAESTAWQKLCDAMKRAYDGGDTTYQEIGDAVDLTKARAYQIITGKR